MRRRWASSFFLLWIKFLTDELKHQLRQRLNVGSGLNGCFDGARFVAGSDGVGLYFHRFELLGLD